MKRIFRIFLIVMFLIPLGVLALEKEYDLTNYGIKISISSDYETIIKGYNNLAEYDRLGVDEEQVMNYMDSLNAYVLATTQDFQKNIIFTRSQDSYTEDYYNLSDLDSDIVNALADGYSKSFGGNYNIEKINGITYMVFKYDLTSVQNEHLYYYKYKTFYNGYDYTIYIQKYSEITSDDEVELKNIINNIIIKEIKKTNTTSSGYSITVWAFIIFTIGTIIFGIIKSKKKNSKTSKIDDKKPVVNNFKENAHINDDIDESIEKIEVVTIDESIYKKAVELCLSGENKEAESNFKEYISQVVKNNKGEKYTTCNNILEFYIYCSIDKPKDELKDLNYRINTAYFYLASMEYDKGNNEEAIAYLDKGLKYNPVDTTIMFEKAENYKALRDMKKFFDINNLAYKYIYDKKDLAKYYRNVGYYYIEKKNWELAKAIYLYSLRFEKSPVVNKELEYIVSNSDSNMPAKNRLENILSKNNIPLFINEDVIEVINKLKDEVNSSGNSNTNVGKFIKNVADELQI